MSEETGVTPDLSYEPGVIGPFVPADILIFAITCVIGFSAAQLDGRTRYATMMAFVVAGSAFVALRRFRPGTGKSLADFLIYTVGERVRPGRLVGVRTGRNVRNAAASLILEEINFISAEQREKERFISVFVESCCIAEKPINFASFPAGLNGFDATHEVCGADAAYGRRFVATVTDEEQAYCIMLLSGKSKYLPDPGAVSVKRTPSAAEARTA